MAAAPAPLITNLTLSIFFFCTCNALSRAAALMMAVPCWSSCMTGMESCSRRAFSIRKHSGALISSRLMPPNVGSSAFTICTNFSGSFSLISISKTSMSAKILNSTPLPSITGLLASGPILPRPSTAVPLLITATRLPLAVFINVLFMGCDLFAGLGYAGRVGQGEVALGFSFFRRHYFDFPGPAFRMVLEGLLLA
jgi:hypothetical protein